MSVYSGQSVTIEFATSSPSTQAATNADSLPTSTLVLNGVDNAATVTVTNVDTGRYKAAVTLPALAVGDLVELWVTATVGGITGKAPVWRDTKDVLIDLGKVKLAADGLDTISVADPGGVSSMTTLATMIVALWRRFFKKTTLNSINGLRTFANDGTTINTTQAVSDDGTTQTQGSAT